MDIKLDQILFQIVNFGVVFGALTYFLYKPVVKMLDERAKKVVDAEKASNEALREREEAETLKSKTKSQAEKEAGKYLEKAKEQAATYKKELMQEAKDEVKAERDKAMKAWETEKASMAREMQKEFTLGVYTVAEKLLGKAVDKKAHADLIDKSLKELAKAL
ncbi:MAG: ATP synthase F0 subunit B [Candidatus Pacebacteria bacterium]|nr:ATP synthase F0 subunit B [Candidatus Paceibacterota bacterium]